MKTRRLIALPIAAALLLVGACGSKEAPEPGGPGSEAAQVAGSAINPKPREELQQGGTLRLPITDFVYWNPMNVNGNEADYSKVVAAFLPGLTIVQDGNPVIDPNFVVSAEVKSESPTVIEWKLNPKAVWGDGTPLSWQDYEATWKANNGSNKGFQTASTQGWDQISKVEKGADDQTFTVTFKGAYPDWMATGSILKADSVKDPDTFNKGWSDIDKVASNGWLSGPFTLDSFDATGKKLVLKPNDKWWGEKPLLDKIQWTAISADAQANAYVNNEYDSFEVGIDPDAFAKATGYADGQVLKAAGPNFRHFTFNTQAASIKDVKVRQAIVMGLDRASIGNSDLAGIDWQSEPLNNNIFLANQEQYVDMAEKTGITYDQAKAKSTLEEAGYTLNGEYYEKDGKVLTVKFTQIQGVPVSENEAKQFQAQLKQVGIKVDIVDATQENWIDKLSSHEFEVFAFSWIGTAFPYQFKQIYGTDQESNFGQLSVPEIDKLADEVDVTTDKAKRTDLANQAAQLIWENVGTLPLYQRPTIVATKKTVANYGAFGLESIKWENVGFTG